MFCRLIGASDIVIALSGLAVVAGHNWPIFFSFRGGKGAATTLGVFFAIDPLLTFVAFLVIMLIVAVTQYMSVGSIAGAISIPFVLYARGHSKVLVVFGALFTLLIIWRHLPNIKRLLQGTENKISKNAYKR
jgi:glycerol-3-phosphate acyltransferase PlsY